MELWPLVVFRSLFVVARGCNNTGESLRRHGPQDVGLEFV